MGRKAPLRPPPAPLAERTASRSPPPMRPLVLAALVLALAACGGEPEPSPALAPGPGAASSLDGPLDGGLDPADDARTIYGVVGRTPELSTLAALVDAAGLRDVLADPDAALTLFAPSDAAFDALGADALDALRSNPEAARALLLDHALSTRMLSGDVLDGLGIETMAGREIALAAGPDGVTVRDGTGVTAAVVEADLDADNGVVHVIDAVLSGPDAP